MPDDFEIQPLEATSSSPLQPSPQSGTSTIAGSTLSASPEDTPEAESSHTPTDTAELSDEPEDQHGRAPSTETSHLEALRSAHQPPERSEQPEPAHKAARRQTQGADIPTGNTRILDQGKRVAGGQQAEFQKFYLNHGNSYVPDCNGPCALGRAGRNEEPGVCEGTATLAHASARTPLPESALPQKSEGEYQNAPINAAAAVQQASDRKWNIVSYHDAPPAQVLDRVKEQVDRFGSGILGMSFTNPDGSKGTGHALLVTDVHEGTASYTRPDGGTEPRAARIFSYLDPNQRDGIPADPSNQQAIVHFTDTNEVSWTKDVREFYRPDPKQEDQAVPQVGTFLKRGEIDYGTMSEVQVANLVRRLRQGADYFARPAQ